MNTTGLIGKCDEYDGFSIGSIDNSALTPEELDRELTLAVAAWSAARLNGIWFRVEKQHANWIPVLLKHAFDFHHAQPGYVMMTRWLPGGQKSPLPAFAFTNIGVGGLVVDPTTGKILLIREKMGPYKGWKFPGGLADYNEDIMDTAKREVKEETGIVTDAKCILCFRHQHYGSRWKWKNCSDIYFVCLLHVKEGTSTDTVPCAREIAECGWFTVDEILKFPEEIFGSTSMFALQRYVDVASKSGPLSIHLKQHVTMKDRSWNMYCAHPYVPDAKY